MEKLRKNKQNQEEDKIPQSINLSQNQKKNYLKIIEVN